MQRIDDGAGEAARPACGRRRNFAGDAKDGKRGAGRKPAIGLDRKGIKRMVRLESLVISLFGGVLGIGLGVFFGWAAGELVGSRMPTYELVLPWARMALFLLLAGTVGVLAALWPARRAARLDMLTAIKSE